MAFSLVRGGGQLRLRRYVWLSASALALMFVLFVTTMHVPNALRGSDRFGWIVALRDLSFGGGAMCLAGASGLGRRADGSSWLNTLGRLIVSVALMTFGVLHVMYPANAPGVPLQKMTPPWIPLPAVWGYLTGAIEIAAGALMLVDRHTRAAASWMGLVVTVLVLVIYTPIPRRRRGGQGQARGAQLHLGHAALRRRGVGRGRPMDP